MSGKTSCVKRPKNDYFLKIHDWQIEFCIELGEKKAAIAAALMSVFEHSYDAENKTPQPYTNEYLSKSIKRLAGKNITIECRKFLVSKGVISEHSSITSTFDKRTFILFHPSVLNDWLKENN